MKCVDILTIRHHFMTDQVFNALIHCGAFACGKAPFVSSPVVKVTRVWPVLWPASAACNAN